MKSFIISITVILLTISLSAKTVTGYIVDESSSPIEFANITLLSMPDSTFIAGQTSDEHGFFAFENLPDKSMIAKFSSIGYDTSFKIVTMNGDLGEVTMKSANVILNEVTVKAYRPIVKSNSEGLTRNVESSILKDAGNAEDVLTKIPMVTKNGNELIVFGKGAPTIYVDNREIRDAQELSRISSNDIKEIEVITNPGIKYNSASNAIIHIKTKTSNPDGISGSVRTTMEYNRSLSSSNTLDLSYRYRNWDIFTNIEFSRTRNHSHTTTQMNSFGINDMLQSLMITNNSTERRLNGKLGFSFMPSTGHSIGAFYQNGINRSKTSYSVDTHTTIESHADIFTSSNGEIRDRKFPCHNLNAYYSGKIFNVGINMNIDYIKSKNKNNQTAKEQEGTEISSLTSTGSRKISLFAQRLAVDFPVKNLKFNLGEEYSRSLSESVFHTDIENLDNATSYVNENNVAIFGDAAFQFKNLTFKAGLRYEHITSIHRESDMSDGNTDKRRFDSFFPSFSITANTGNVRTAINFTRKSIRPDYESLDGTIIYVNPLTLQSGNPFLKPTTTYNLELLANWKWLTGQLRYSRAENPIFNTIIPHNEEGIVKRLTKSNFPNMSKVEVFLSGIFQIRAWNPKLNFGLSAQNLDMEYRGKKKSLNRPVVLVQWQNEIKLPYDIRISADMGYYGNGYIGNLYHGSSSFMDVKIMKFFFSEKLRVSLEGRDIFNQSNRKMRFYSNEVTMLQFPKYSTRSIIIGVSYRFNSTPRRYKGTGAAHSEKSRLGIN
ncbi:MAG: TonB-dependent receptor [Lachnospiraceae bacterium]|nr:TonB-dependent receptor [Lachnospiraceae bacterium]